MKNLEAREIAGLRNRWNHFYDGVIRKINIVFSRPITPCKIEITISTKCNELEKPDWVNVLFVIDDVQDFTIRDGAQGCYQVLSSGLHILHEQGRVLLEFDDYSDAGPASIATTKSSNFYIIGKSVGWEEQPYAE